MKLIDNVITTIAKCLVFWDKAFNHARPSGDYGTKEEKTATAKQLAHGWSMDKHVKVRRITKDEQAQAVLILKSRWEGFQAAAKKDPKDATLDLQIFERIHLDPKTRKIVTPEYVGVDGNRRDDCWIEAQRLRLLKPEEYGAYLEEPSTKNPEGVFYPPYSLDAVCTELNVRLLPAATSELDIALMQVADNALNDKGFKQMTQLDFLCSAEGLVDLGCGQARLRKEMGDSLGAKAYWFVVLNNQFKSLNLIPRCKLPETDPARINYVSLKMTDIQTLGQRLRMDTLVKLNKRRGADKQETLLTEADARDWFANPNKKTPTVRAMARPDMINLATGTKSDAINLIATDIANGNQIRMKQFVLPVSDIFNDVLRMNEKQRKQVRDLIATMKLGDKPQYDALLTAAADVPAPVSTTAEADPEFDPAPVPSEPAKGRGRNKVAAK